MFLGGAMTAHRRARDLERVRDATTNHASVQVAPPGDAVAILAV